MIYSWEQYLHKLEMIWQVNYWDKKDKNQRFVKDAQINKDLHSIE